MKELSFTLFFFLFLTICPQVSPPLQAQEPLSLEIPEEEPLFLSGLTPVILPKEAIEINSFNSLASFWRAVRQFRPDQSPLPFTNRYRLTLLDHYLRISYGFSDNQRWDLGAEFRFSHRRLDDEASSSPFRIFGADNSTGNTIKGLALAGARLRYQPFRNLASFTLQGALTFPVGGDEEERALLGANQVHLDLAATYYEGLTDRTYYYLQGGWLFQLKSEENNKTTYIPSVSGFLVRSFFYHRLYVYPGITYSTSLQHLSNGSGLRRTTQQLLGGLGLQYSPVRGFNISLYGQLAFILESGSAIEEWMRESYSSVSLGLLLRL